MRANDFGGIDSRSLRSYPPERRRYIPGMRLTGRSDDELLTEAWAYLTAEELVGLFQSLTYYFAGDQDDPGWHCHVGDVEGGPELTIAIEN
jgi:hypothetical protein